MCDEMSAVPVFVGYLSEYTATVCPLFTETSRKNLHVTGWMNLRKSFRGANASFLLSLAQLQSCHYQGPPTPRTLTLIITGLLLLYVVQTKKKQSLKRRGLLHFARTLMWASISSVIWQSWKRISVSLNTNSRDLISGSGNLGLCLQLSAISYLPFSS